MPFSQLKRQDSFPPTIIHISPQLTSHDSAPPALAIQDLHSKPLPALPQHIKDINNDPISFFLTAPTDTYDPGSDEELEFLLEEQDDYSEIYDDDDDLSAGIEGSDEDLLKLKRDAEVREISPSSLQRTRTEADESAILDEVEFGFAMPLSLKDFTSRSAPIVISEEDTGRLSRAAYHPETLRQNGLAMHPPSAVSRLQREKDRGRGRFRLSPPAAGRSLSWSPPGNIGSGRRKPVSWRTPSKSIWTIDEGDEVDGCGMLSRSAPSASYMRREPVAIGVGGLKKDDGRVKVVKKVRWADLEE